MATGREMSDAKIATINSLAKSSNYSRGSIQAPLIMTLHTIQHWKGAKRLLSISFWTKLWWMMEPFRHSKVKLSGRLSAANVFLPLSCWTSRQPFRTALLGKWIRTMPGRATEQLLSVLKRAASKSVKGKNFNVNWKPRLRQITKIFAVMA